MVGYNSGDDYEEKIYDICKDKKIIPLNFYRAGAAGNKADIIFVHLGKEYNLEIKNMQNPDYGQKKLDYDLSKKVWSWVNENDPISIMYTKLGLINNIDENFIPIWYQKRQKVDGKYTSVPGKTYSLEDFKMDQSKFNYPLKKVPLETLFEYYSNKNTYYIQVEGSGFYHLKKDVANLNTPQFDGDISLRFRLKHAGHTKHPPHSCQFLGALKLTKKPTKSKYNLEDIEGQSFPKIQN